MDDKQRLMLKWKDQLALGSRELKAFESVEREDFVDPKMKALAYEDHPLPILRGKTISQPSTVMLMTQALEIQAGETVLEVGTGSGYQTAILAQLVGRQGRVVSTEILPELVQFARSNLDNAGVTNVKVFEDDGAKGIDMYAPYDKIIVTAAAVQFPPALIDQLKPDGLIIGPVGDAKEQEMVLARKDANGKLEMEFLGQFLFSPLAGTYGFDEED